MPKYSWTLSWFDPKTEKLVGEVEIKSLSGFMAAKVLGVPEDQILGGEFPIDSARAERLEAATGRHSEIDQYDYFLGATAVAD